MFGAQYVFYHDKISFMSNHAVVAGTFDHLHRGHQQLLTTAINSVDTVSCGLSRSSLTQTKSFPTLIQSFKKRRQQIVTFLSKHADNYAIFPLKNALEPASHSQKFDSIIATRNTIKNVNLINHLRAKNHLKPLQPVIIDLFKSTDQKTLSSTRIRRGVVNRQGFAYCQLFSKNQVLHLPDTEKQSLRRPFDTLLYGSQTHLAWAAFQAKKIITKTKPLITIAVGDIAIVSLLQQNLHLQLAIADLKTKRQQIFSGLGKLGLHSTATHKAINPASTLTPTLIRSLKLGIKQSLITPQSTQSILVDGEEDLAVLPAILLSPLNTAIFYGQPNQGLVYIRVTEKCKQKALSLLQKFI